MSIKRSVASVLAGLVFVIAITTPRADAQVTGDSGATTAVVNVSEGGEFDASFCHTASNLTLVTQPSASSPGKAQGAMFICYVDTMSFRPSFTVQVNSGSFTSSSTNSVIQPDNFSITRTWKVSSNQSSSTSSLPIGDIASLAENGSLVTTPAPGLWTGPNNTLDQTRSVQVGFAGVGTLESDGQFDVELSIPIGTAAGVYESEVTLTVVPGT